MARGRRIKARGAARYRVGSRTAGRRGWEPLGEDAVAAGELERRLLFYCGVYRCRLVSHQVLGDGVEAVVEFERPRRLSRRLLLEAARKLYGKRLGAETRRWGKADWRRFARRLFDLSCLMRDLKGTFATWYNRRHRRRGPLWAERFKSTVLLDEAAFRAVAAGVELAGARGGAGRPRPWGSARLRARGDDPRLAPVGEVFPPPPGWPPHRHYRALMRYLGTPPGEGPEREVPRPVLRWARRSGLRRGQMLEAADPAYADGLALGGRERVQRFARRLARQGLLPPGSQPVPCRDGRLWKLREQRSRRHDW